MKRKALTVTGWLISIAVTAYLLGTANISELIGSFASTDIWYLALATIINIGVLALKGIRWQLLILPQKKTAFWGMFKATTIGYAANNILPARGGDLLKIFLVH
ncbi:MAG TPA: lysylphosphatidylglycerol synthase domain-containing protein, partial [bacterium]|nr:lysylphosphatidylglycerol synthase domain-containing protein [bacterium]